MARQRAFASREFHFVAQPYCRKRAPRGPDKALTRQVKRHCANPYGVADVIVRIDSSSEHLLYGMQERLIVEAIARCTGGARL